MGRAERADAAPHFASQEDRDRWQVQQYGHVRDGFRTELDRTDERPLLVYAHPFWASAEEEARYERAVKACPVREYGALRLDQYLAEVVTVAEGIRPQGTAVKAMPSGPWQDR